jgi:hypothetical protein
VRDVRDRDPEPEAARASLREHGVVVVARAQRIDRHEGQRAQVESRRVGGLGARRLQLPQHRGRELARQPVQIAERGEVEIRVADAAEPPLRVHAPAPLEAHRHDVARGEGRVAPERRAERAVVGMRPQLEASRCRAHHGACARASLRARAGLASATGTGAFASFLQARSVDALMGAA